MYHCHIHFYLLGRSGRIFETIREMSPFEHFTHEFMQSDEYEKALAQKADVILADVQEQDIMETVKAIIEDNKGKAEIILLAKQEQTALLMEQGLVNDVKDIWTMPMSDKEVSFRFLRWQENCKMSKDYWQTNQYFETTINHIPSLIWYKSKDGIHEKVNDSFCKVVNKTKEQVEGQRHAYIWNVEQDDPACIESELEVMTKKETGIAEEEVQTGEGVMLLTTYKSPLYDLDGSVMGTVGVGIDITQERAYHQEMMERNRLLEKVFSVTDCGMICHTVDGLRILSINAAALRILGYESQDEMMATGFNMIASTVVDEDKERMRACIESLEKEGDSVSIEYRVQHMNGDIRYIMGNIKLLEENGERFYQRFLLDCTTQKQQEKKERKKIEKRHREIVQALSTDYKLVCMLDIDTGEGSLVQLVDCANNVLSSIFEGEESIREGLERYIQTCVYEDDREMLRKAVSLEKLQEELREKKVCYVNYRVFCNNEIRYFQMKAVRTNREGANRGVVLGFRSVDEEIRKEMEQKNLLEDALLQANRASKAKSVFLSNMSHDIRTPMNAIVGFTSLAITHIDRREQVESYLKKIMASGNHLLSLINDVLDMSRIESGKMRLEEKLCSLPDILQSLRSILQGEIRAKQLELYIDTVDVFDEEIYCDKLRLNQVLLNLLSNAVKYTGAGGIVSMRITERGGAPMGSANYEFHIKDTGIGMSEEFVSHIFEPFERERNTTISGIQGTGLGMAITKNIVDMMNGSIEVKSEQGTGTEVIVSFTFRLHTGEKEPQDIPEFKNCRALVVDDDFNTCDSVSYMLGQVGMRADWTLSGKEAVLRTRQAMMRNDNYCVYIIDWLLPDMNGIEVTRRIRQEMGEEVPVIVLTAYDWADIEDEAREAGVTAFCSKPLFFSELRSCLYSIVSSDDEKEQKNVQRPDYHTGRILLAEDNELNQEIAEAILTEAGFGVEIAGNGKIAVDMLEQSEPGYYHLVLMDVQMPEMNGYEATRAIRKMENTEKSSIPIIAMTANAFEEDKQQALNSGMNAHIAKPIDVKILFDTLDKILN